MKKFLSEVAAGLTVLSLVSGAVVAKVSKPQQDNRFDVPTVGYRTVENMAKVGATVLAIEAGKTLLVERERMISFADENGISIVAM